MSKEKSVKFLLLLLVGAYLSACGTRHLNDDDAVVFPAKFSEIRNRIIIPKCANCHGALVSYKEFFKEVHAQPSDAPGALLHLIKSGAMPQYGQPLATAEITAIEAWINAGAKND